MHKNTSLAYHPVSTKFIRVGLMGAAFFFSNAAVFATSPGGTLISQADCANPKVRDATYYMACAGVVQVKPNMDPRFTEKTWLSDADYNSQNVTFFVGQTNSNYTTYGNTTLRFGGDIAARTMAEIARSLGSPAISPSAKGYGFGTTLTTGPGNTKLFSCQNMQDVRYVPTKGDYENINVVFCDVDILIQGLQSFLDPATEMVINTPLVLFGWINQPRPQQVSLYSPELLSTSIANVKSILSSTLIPVIPGSESSSSASKVAAISSAIGTPGALQISGTRSSLLFNVNSNTSTLGGLSPDGGAPALYLNLWGESAQVVYSLIQADQGNKVTYPKTVSGYISEQISAQFVTCTGTSESSGASASYYCSLQMQGLPAAQEPLL